MQFLFESLVRALQNNKSYSGSTILIMQIGAMASSIDSLPKNIRLDKIYYDGSESDSLTQPSSGHL
jgi:hypothetical protein